MPARAAIQPAKPPGEFKTILYGSSSKGVKGQAERLSYCPDEYQRLHAEAQAKNKAEVEQRPRRKG